jgi:hypothetical protein
MLKHLPRALAFLLVCVIATEPARATPRYNNNLWPMLPLGGPTLLRAPAPPGRVQRRVLQSHGRL